MLSCVTIYSSCGWFWPLQGHLPSDGLLSKWEFSQSTTWGSLRDFFFFFLKALYAFGDAYFVNYLLLLSVVTHFVWNEFFSCLMVDGSFRFSCILLLRHGRSTKEEYLYGFSFLVVIWSVWKDWILVSVLQCSS